VATAIRPVGYDDRLSVVEHLDELRNRLIISGIAFAVAFTVCMVFNHQLLEVVNHPLKVTTEKRTEEGKGILGEIFVANRTIRGVQASNERIFRAIAPTLKPAQRALVERELAGQARDIAQLKSP
jgi:sec-independent protein translocase protein TatC